MINIFIICNKSKENDRIQNIENQIKNLDNNIFNINFYNFIWFDEIDENIVNKYCKTDNSMKYHGREKNIKPLTKGEISLVLNNINCLKYIKDNFNNGNFIILESDFLFINNFDKNIIKLMNYINNIDNWDIINIGTGFRSEMEHEIRKSDCIIFENIKFYKEIKNCCTEGIIWNYNSINKFLNYFNIEEDINGPWDTMLDLLSIYINNSWNIYWSEPAFVSQGSILGMFNSKIH